MIHLQEDCFNYKKQINDIEERIRKEMYYRKLIDTYENNDLLYILPICEAKVILDTKMDMKDYYEKKRFVLNNDLLCNYSKYYGYMFTEADSENSKSIPVYRENIEDLECQLISLRKKHINFLKLIDSINSKKQTEILMECFMNTNIKLSSIMTENESLLVSNVLSKQKDIEGNSMLPGTDIVFDDYLYVKKRYKTIKLKEFRTIEDNAKKRSYLLIYSLPNTSISIVRKKY